MPDGGAGDIKKKIKEKLGLTAIYEKKYPLC